MPHALQMVPSGDEGPYSDYDKTLALRPGLALATGSNASAAVTASDLQLRAVEMEQRRQDRQIHHHSQIWTKDYHGGPYRKISGSCT